MEYALLAKINCIRLTIAFAVSLVMHCGIMDSMESGGELDEDTLHELVFLHHRLQQLLYAEEMMVVDEAISICRDPPEQQQGWCGGDREDTEEDAIYRAEVSRYRIKNDNFGLPLLGSNVQGRTQDFTARGADRGSFVERPDVRQDVVVAPLPKVIVGMLFQALKEPISQPWGYPERMLNVFAAEISRISDSIAHITAVCTMPTPLPYIQLSHLLVMCFASLFPWSVPVEEGIMNNVIMPFMIFFVICAFETLAKMMETPTGHDSTDLNFMEMLQGLEVQCAYAFDVTEMHNQRLHNALAKPAHSFGFSCASEFPLVEDSSSKGGPPRHFNAYFRWLPIPTMLLEVAIMAHGDVDMLHQASRASKVASLRQLIRSAFPRRMHNGNSYTAIQEHEDTDTDVTKALDAMRNDPNIFCHYVAFNGILPKRQVSAQAPESKEFDKLRTREIMRHNEWTQRVGKMLANHSTAGLFGVVSEDDSQRSVIERYTEAEGQNERSDRRLPQPAVPANNLREANPGSVINNGQLRPATLVSPLPTMFSPSTPG